MLVVGSDNVIIKCLKQCNSCASILLISTQNTREIHNKNCQENGEMED